MLFLSRLLVLLALALALSAQEAPPKPDAATASPTPDATVATPSDPAPVAATQADVAPPDDSQAPANHGPGILSRSFTTTPLENQQLRFRPFFSVSGIADNGLIGVSNSTSGHISNTQNYGVDAGFGIEGRRLFKHDTFELEFQGDAFHYTPSTVYDGGNYLLMATYQHQFNRKMSLALTENAGLYSNNYSLSNSTTDLSLGGTNLLVTPNTQIFDNTTLYLSTGADLTIQQSNRLSFNLGGTGFLVRRDSSSLYGTTGAQARADVTYRLTRHTTIGTYYGFTDYSFNKAFGGSLTNTLGLELSYQLTRTVEIRFRGGASRVVTDGTQVIVLDPVIAAILGESNGVIAIHRINFVPDVTAQIFKTLKVGTASFEYIGNVTPGNGIILTSRHLLLSGHYDYNGLRRWTMSIGASRDVLNTLGVQIGTYSSYIGHLGVGRTISHGFQANLNFEYRHFDVTEVAFLRNAYRASLGLTWSPGERPLKGF